MNGDPLKIGYTSMNFSEKSCVHKNGIALYIVFTQNQFYRSYYRKLIYLLEQIYSFKPTTPTENRIQKKLTSEIKFIKNLQRAFFQIIE